MKGSTFGGDVRLTELQFKREALNLEILRNPCTYPTDLSDGILQVSLTELCVQSLVDHNTECIVPIELDQKVVNFNAYKKQAELLFSRFHVPTKARFEIRPNIAPKLSIAIDMHVSGLVHVHLNKDDELPMVLKYLVRWGLVNDTAVQAYQK